MDMMAVRDEGRIGKAEAANDCDFCSISITTS